MFLSKIGNVPSRPGHCPVPIGMGRDREIPDFKKKLLQVELNKRRFTTIHEYKSVPKDFKIPIAHFDLTSRKYGSKITKLKS